MEYYFTTKEISLLLKTPIQFIRKMIREKRIIVYKVGRQYIIKEQDYFIFSTKKYEDNKYSESDLNLYMELIKQHFYHDGIINCLYIENNNIVDNLLLIPKTIINV